MSKTTKQTQAGSRKLSRAAQQVFWLINWLKVAKVGLTGKKPARLTLRCPVCCGEFISYPHYNEEDTPIDGYSWDAICSKCDKK